MIIKKEEEKKKYMGEEDEKLVAETPQPSTTTETPPTVADTQSQKEEKELPQQPSPLPPPLQPPIEDRAPALVLLKELQPADDKALVPAVVVLVEKPEPSSEKKPEDEGKSINKEAVLARIETEKRMSLIRAWEDNEKCKAENKAWLSSIHALENSQKASIEAELKLNEERLEMEKAIYAEKMRNKIGMIHKEADEKKAMVEAKKWEQLLKVEEMAAEYRATGKTPKKMFGYF